MCICCNTFFCAVYAATKCLSEGCPGHHMLPMTVDFQSAETVIVRKAIDPMKNEKKKNVNMILYSDKLVDFG